MYIPHCLTAPAPAPHTSHGVHAPARSSTLQVSRSPRYCTSPPIIVHCTLPFVRLRLHPFSLLLHHYQASSSSHSCGTSHCISICIFIHRVLHTRYIHIFPSTPNSPHPPLSLSLLVVCCSFLPLPCQTIRSAIHAPDSVHTHELPTRYGQRASCARCLGVWSVCAAQRTYVPYGELPILSVCVGRLDATCTFTSPGKQIC
ncbi:hypothetical protein C8Q74DRAFT_694169 [Fomes fomentarius]|nr:hypothetical protein C8Q74DRAFT_694169 [Fomes fomentarius]